ncbi:hypothetical protein ASD15_13225 [Massilia sp. Root351]|jgi:hypothetical protein|uniref:LVIVD repeat-containing protein n=1 Tax=Massilia sp. Root351 TaxID=1736522 RepID=UPI00070B26B4|nr:hypothetical protein [Massilia sp. Root351]KQV80858.1 hypothetical protein ASD15_13225 [Massilia sp. Root351]
MKTKFLPRLTITLCAAAVAGSVLAQQPRSGANLNAPDAPGPNTKEIKLLPGEPPLPAPGSWGYDEKTGKFKSPDMTPDVYGAHPVAGSLSYLDQNQYAKNVKLEGFIPEVAGAGHSWQATLDWEGRRYLYDYETWMYNLFDITDPKNVKVVQKKTFKTKEGEHQFGPFNVKFNKKLNKMIAVQCYEISRYGLIWNKYTNPEQVENARKKPMLRGFRIYEVTSPQWTDWKLLSETALDESHSAKDPVQEGSGCQDVPVYNGDQYLFVAGAPDNSFANTEYKTYLHAGAQLVYDVSDPAKPKRLSMWWAPGSRVGEEEEYKKNPRAGNKTSWMGARMPLFIPKPVEQGGKYGYAAMGGFGFYVIDISDPKNMKQVAHIDMPVSVTGTEGDNIDVTKVESTGMVYYSGYPMSEDCYEPLKAIYSIDVRDPLRPKIVNVLPTPTPPKEAPFTDYCQRRGSFGPKRSGYTAIQPGTPSPRYMPYSYYNAGLQIFDVKDPLKPVIAGYFVPKMVDAGKKTTDGQTLSIRALPNPVHSIFVEWDRNLVWVFSNHGIYTVSTELLGKPVFGMPPKK